ncbi:MAG: alkaline phosphatase family protein [Actinomycetota bacterium]|nr:alkaline phosphatase family protein [Actinomycetota bacterium]
MSDDPTPKAGVSRRRFIGGAATTVGALALGGPSALAGKTPGADASSIEHVVVVMMENRSFDHLLGWVPGADGRQAGLTYDDASGTPHATHPLAPDYQGCAHPDPDHSYEGGRVEYDNGACDGWLRAGSNDEYAIGYYKQKDLAFLGRAVPQWTTLSRYHAAILAETYPNRIYQHAAQTDRLHNTSDLCTLPTIWDRLADAGRSGRYYYGDLPFLALWGAKYQPISRPVVSFFADCAAGTLADVTYVDPRFLDESSGTSGDDHPHADIRNGEYYMERIYRAVTTGPNWPRTVLVFNYDEWGGFYDHVPPPTAPVPPATQAAGDQDGRLGFRVPTLVVSPWARRGYVGRRFYDHTSVLRLIESRWALPSLTVRDRTANNLAEVLDFSKTDPRAPQYDVPAGPFGAPCGTPSAGGEDWTGLVALARTTGWPV